MFPELQIKIFIKFKHPLFNDMAVTCWYWVKCLQFVLILNSMKAVMTKLFYSFVVFVIKIRITETGITFKLCLNKHKYNCNFGYYFLVEKQMGITSNTNPWKSALLVRSAEATYCSCTVPV